MGRRESLIGMTRFRFVLGCQKSPSTVLALTRSIPHGPYRWWPTESCISDSGSALSATRCCRRSQFTDAMDVSARPATATGKSLQENQHQPLLWFARGPDGAGDVPFLALLVVEVVGRHALAVGSLHGARIAQVPLAPVIAQDDLLAPGLAVVITDDGPYAERCPYVRAMRPSSSRIMWGGLPWLLIVGSARRYQLRPLSGDR